MKNKYEDLDKQISKEVMSEFTGKTVQHKCPTCYGLGNFKFGNPDTGTITSVIMCDDCKGTGIIEIEY